MSHDRPNDNITRVIRHPAADRLVALEEPGSDGGAEISLSQLARFFRTAVMRRWKLVVVVWLAVLVPVIGYALTAVPRYTASGAVQVSDGAGLLGASPLAEIVGGGGQADVQTEVEILRRREFLVAMLRDLRLHVIDPEEPRWITNDLTIALGGASPVDPRLNRVRNALRLARAGAGQYEPIDLALEVSDEHGGVILYGEQFEHEISFVVGEKVQAPMFEVAFDEVPLDPGERIELQILPEGALIEAYGRDIHVRGLGTIRQPTNIVEISVSSTDRDTARAIVQAMMDRYLKMTLDWHSQSAAQVAAFIDRQLDDVRTSLTDAEARMEEYAEKENAVQLDVQAKVAIERAAELEAQRVQLQIQEHTIGSVLERMRGKRRKGGRVTANFFEDPVLAMAVEGLMESEVQYETLQASLTTNHPQVQELGRALDLQKKEVARLMRSARRNLVNQRKQVERELDSLVSNMGTYPVKQLALARIMRDMKVSERLYTLLLEKREEAEIMKASTTIDKRIVDAPSVPHKKSSPQRRKLLGLGGLAGFMLGVALAVGQHFLNNRLDTVEAVQGATELPTYGLIPLVEGERGEGERLDLHEVWASPHDPAPEAFRALAVGVSFFPTADRRGCVVALTSSRAGEGKSTVASNLAMALARAGKRVVLVDLDLRKPVQHRIWGLSRAPGYADLLSQVDPDDGMDSIAHFGVEDGRVTVLTAGTRLPDTVAAVMSPRVPSWIERWRSTYEFVIIDLPPAFVPETAVLASHVDLTLLVARPGRVVRGDLRAALSSIARAEVPCGLVLNAVGRHHSEDTYGAAYYGYYAAHYQDGGSRSELDGVDSPREAGGGFGA